MYFLFFWNHYYNKKEANIFKRNIISTSGNRFLQFFSDNNSNGSSFSVHWNPKTVSQFLKKSIIPVIWNHFFGFAGIPVSKSIFFQLVETVFSSNPSLRLVYRGFGFKQCAFIQCLFSLLVMNKIFHVLKFLEFINELWKICFPLGKNV